MKCNFVLTKSASAVDVDSSIRHPAARRAASRRFTLSGEVVGRSTVRGSSFLGLADGDERNRDDDSNVGMVVRA